VTLQKADLEICLSNGVTTWPPRYHSRMFGPVLRCFALGFAD
jgi:hypothetical protein